MQHGLLLLLLEDRTISSTGSSVISGRNFQTNTIASAHSPAKTTMTPPRLIAFWVTGKISMMSKPGRRFSSWLP